MARELPDAEINPEGEEGSLLYCSLHRAAGFIFALRVLQWPRRYLAILVLCFKPKFILARKGDYCKMRLTAA